VEIILHDPTHDALHLHGVVRHVFTKEGPQGIGVQLQAVAAQDQQRYVRLLQMARAMAGIQRSPTARDRERGGTPGANRPGRAEAVALSRARR